MIHAPSRSNTEAELQAFEQTCERLAGFVPELNFEQVDGLLCALAAGPTDEDLAGHLPVLLGDAWERAYADPQAQAEALAALQARLRVLRSQLDPEAMFDDPEALRLEPLMSEWGDEDRARLVADGVATAQEAALLQTGVGWAMGFLTGVERLPSLWALPNDAAVLAVFEQSFEQIEALLLDPASEEYRAHIARSYPDGEPTRDDLLAEACYSVQDLRLYWVDFAPKTATRRVEAKPGRNDPCPCGSGKKFKKCHGAG